MLARRRLKLSREATRQRTERREIDRAVSKLFGSEWVKMWGSAEGYGGGDSVGHSESLRELNQTGALGSQDRAPVWKFRCGSNPTGKS